MMPHYNIKLTVVRHVEVHGVDEVIVRVVPGLVTGPEDIAEYREYVGVLGGRCHALYIG